MGATMTSQDDIRTVSEVTSLLKVAEKTSCGLAQKGDLPGLNAGGQRRFSRTAIDSWIEATRVPSAQLAFDGAKPARSKRED